MDEFRDRIYRINVFHINATHRKSGFIFLILLLRVSCISLCVVYDFHFHAYDSTRVETKTHPKTLPTASQPTNTHASVGVGIHVYDRNFDTCVCAESHKGQVGKHRTIKPHRR